MRTVHFRRFTNPALLRRAGRLLLDQLFGQFEPYLDAAGRSLPGPDADDEAYYDAVAGLLLRPEGLPDELNDALFAIEEMATEEGQERLEQAVRDEGLELAFAPADTHLDVALQVWLAAPQLLARKYNETRMQRLRRFEYFSPSAGNAHERGVPDQPGMAAMASLTAALDQWFALNRRGQGTTCVEWYPIAGEWWFLIRRGDNFTRATRLETDGPHILHFRPQRDEVVVYNPVDDELRINASLKSVRDLYRREFGRLLRGEEDYFSGRQAYSLEPLRTLRADALRAGGVDGIERIRLTEVEVMLDQGLRQFTVLGAWDLFEAGAAEQGAPVIPLHGRIVSACFDFQFEGAGRAHPVRVCPPNVLKLGRHCDTHAVNTWLKRVQIRTRMAAA